ncbi:MAG: phosphotransferase [Pseudohongiellaceae bacterium]|nr:phosphotransferase [Pseudohongiellaceae bacterium]
MDIRRDELSKWARQWLAQRMNNDDIKGKVSVVSGDASFRRYFRLRLETPCRLGGQNEGDVIEVSSLILVDAPPQHENSRQFVSVAKRLREAGLHTPAVLATDFDNGYMVLEDLGDQLYLPLLKNVDVATKMYRAAIQPLLQLQANASVEGLPPFDEGHIRKELELFSEWFCGRFLGLELGSAERALLDSTWQFLQDSALAQTQVCVHRDYHSRNLMVLNNELSGAPGVIDFQDAVSGPYTYDLVSLLRDCYVVWPKAKVQQWALEYLAGAKDKGIVRESISAQQFLRDFDLVGLQRHLKVIGIFARLYLRDGKIRYMHDIPLVIDYVRSVAHEHQAMLPFLTWFEEKLLPMANEKLAGLEEYRP